MALVFFHQVVFVPTFASFQLCRICIAIDLCLFVVAQLQPQMAYDSILLVQACIQITLKIQEHPCCHEVLQLRFTIEFATYTHLMCHSQII